MGLFSFLDSKPIKEGNYVSKVFKLNGVKTPVRVESADAEGKMVYIDIFTREMSLRIGGTVTPRQTCATAEFFKDAGDIIAALQGTRVLDSQVYFNALLKSCTRHIQDYGRLIDTDLSAYLFTVAQVMNATELRSTGRPIDAYLGSELIEEFKRGAYKAFRNYIWVNQYNPLSANIFDPYELVKLTDLQ
ncbi:hypothetical protein HNQ93_004147 [Hymenobacter luteus]|uniref:Uncharacterized protein n=2 Tax=Hymenobacter TaxID=89966 RepID=A0A7W9WDL6_9BACT|nr:MULTISPECIES: hypothetical protein [Hymenobacter]MBB4603559.1 hypothetical protein [Hymenobacter latericoloratus]MBB6061268.1 hypothetical protein [Hymenobacter luteus]